MEQTLTLSRGAPEAQGIRSSAIQAFLDAAERDIQHLHSVMLLRHGHVVAEGWWEPYSPRSPHVLFSLSKSFTSTAVGLLVAEGRVTIDDTVLQHFPEDAPDQPSDYLRAMQVRHLLSMSAGHATDPTRAVFDQTAVPWTRAFLAQPLEHVPGTRFVYNTAATYMLSAIVQKITGSRLIDYLRPRLFEPLGIENPSWETSPQGIDVGGSGLSVTTADIAHFGQLYLQRGEWHGARILPEAWVEQATARHIANGPSPNPDWEQGYGFQFWRCRHGAYRGDGAFGQFCVVMPQQDAVLAITSGTFNLQGILDIVWQHLLPALEDEPLPDDAAAHAALNERLAALRLPPVHGERTASVASRLTERSFRIAPNDEQVEAIAFAFGEDRCVLSIQTSRGRQQISCGYGTWIRGEAALERAAVGRVAASGAWTDEQTYDMQLWWYETPFGRTLTCRFDGDRLIVDQQANASFGSTERPRLEGRLQPG